LILLYCKFIPVDCGGHGDGRDDRVEDGEGLVILMHLEAEGKT
jgi:hypothetical protein